MPTQKKYLDNEGLTELLDELGQHLKSKLDKLTVGDGIAIDNSDTIRTTGIPYGECDSTSTATAFTATVPGIYKLEDGVCCMVKNGVVTSAANFTLNINGLGAKPSYNNMATGNDITPTAPTRDTTIFNINYTMLFIYSETIVDGGGWICYRGYDANTNTIGYQVRSNSMSLPASQKFYRYRLLFTSADGTHYVPANTSSSTNATASRTVNQTPIDPFGHIVYYGTTAAVDANARPSATQLWIIYTLTLGYSFNRTGAALTLTSWKPVYVKCTPQENGSAIIDADTPYVQDLPTTADGKIYIFLGVAYSATAIELLNNHPVYYHDGEGIRLWTGKDTKSIEYYNLERDSNLTPIFAAILGITPTLSDLNTACEYLLNLVDSQGDSYGRSKKVIYLFDGRICLRLFHEGQLWNAGGSDNPSNSCEVDFELFDANSNVSMHLEVSRDGSGNWHPYVYTQSLIPLVQGNGNAITGVNTIDGQFILEKDTTFLEELTFDSAPTADSTNPVTSGGVKTALDGKQNLLVSGTNIKTINNNSLVGSGNVTIDSDSITMADADPNDGTWGSGDTIQEAMEGITDGILTVYNEAKPKDFVVTLSKNNSIYTADKTYALILTAYNNGKNVVVKYGTDVLNVSEKYSNSIRFSTSSAEEGVLRGFEVKSNDTWELYQFEAQDHLTFDSTPTANSYNPVTSGGIKEALDGKLDHIELSPLYEYLEGQGAVSEATAVVWNAEMQTLWNKATTQSSKMRTFQGYPAFPEDTGDNTYAWDIYGIFGAAVYIVAKVGYLIDNNGITKYYIAGQEWKILQEHLTFDSTPTSNSNNPVKSSGIKTALDGKQDALVSGTNIKTIHNNSLLGSGNIELTASNIEVQNGDTVQDSIDSLTNAKQDRLVSGTNIKTINNNSLLGSGDVHFDGSNLVYSGDEIQELVAGETIDENLDRLDVLVHGKQDTLVSGTNIKTVNNNSLLGSGNISIEPNEIASITTSESSASGGNNTVTITETNGTTTTFNVKNGIDGQDGADGVSLGEISLVQTTGNATDAVMSQKAVTDELFFDYSMNAYDDVIWETGLINTSNGKNGTNGNQQRTQGYLDLGAETTSVTIETNGVFYAFFYNENDGYLGYRYLDRTSVEVTKTTYPTMRKVRFYGHYNYGTKYYRKNLIIKCFHYELLPTAVKQTTGASFGSLMSQKAITDSIYRNTKIQHCACGFLRTDAGYTILLTDDQYQRINNTEIASFRFVLTEPENAYSQSMTLRYVSITGNSSGTMNGAFKIQWDYSKRMFCAGKNYNTATCVNKTSGGVIINPLVFTVVWDRVNGIIKYYERGNLISTQTYEEYKLDYFIAPSKAIYLYGGDTGFFLYDAQIFDYDISKMSFSVYENTIYGASMVYTKYAGNFKASDGSFVELNGSASTYGGSYNGTIEKSFPGDGTYVMTSTSNCTSSTYITCGYYVGNGTKLQQWECDIEVVSGECKIINGTQLIEKIVSDNGDIFSAGNTLGVGKYTIKGVSGGNHCWNLGYVSGEMKVIYKKQRYKLISCVVHLKCDAFYDGFLYDDQAKHFYDQSNALVPDNTPFTLPRTTTNNPPNYAGQMAVPSNGNIYIGTKNYVWKQINNS